MTIGKRYHQKMWIESINQNNMMMITPKKPTQIRTLTQEDQIGQNITMQNLNRPRQHQNTISRCLNFNTVIIAEEKEKEGTEVLECTKDSQAKGDWLNKNHMRKMYTQLRMSSQEEVEEVIYSVGEAFEEIYPDNKWDSDDALCDDVSLA